MQNWGVTEYQEHFLRNDENWVNILTKVKNYINENNKRPSAHDKNINNKRLANWLQTQQINYIKKEYVMENEQIRT